MFNVVAMLCVVSLIVFFFLLLDFSFLLPVDLLRVNMCLFRLFLFFVFLLVVTLDGTSSLPVSSNITHVEYIVTPIVDVIPQQQRPRPRSPPLKSALLATVSSVTSSMAVRRTKTDVSSHVRTESIIIYNDIHLLPEDGGGQVLRLEVPAFGRNESVRMWPLWNINRGWGFREMQRYVLGPRVPGHTLREVVFVKSNSLTLAAANVTNLFVNIDNSTALLVTHFRRASNSPPEVELFGLLNERLVIMPAWHHLVPKLHDNRAQAAARHQARGTQHLLVDNRQSVSPVDVKHIVQRIHSNVRRSNMVPLPVAAVRYPEVTLLIDYYTYRLHGKNVEQLWRYFVIFFSRLDLIYRQLQQPRIELRLKNIFIAERPLNFQRKPPKGMSNKHINAFKAIHEFGLFVYDHQSIFGGSDIVLVVTGQNLCLAHHTNPNAAKDFDSCDYDTIRGQAFVGGACQHDPQHKRMNVAVIEDHGRFDGVAVAAHELAHVLGSVHDGQWPLSGILGPGGRGCAANGGYLMSHQNTDRRRPKSIEWSVCTREQFDYFLRLPTSVCLYNRPSDNEI